MCPGDKIKQLRKERKMTQEELGKLLGVNKSAIQKYEKGNVINLKLVTIQKLCEIFDTDPSEFIFPKAKEFDQKYNSTRLEFEVKTIESVEDLFGPEMVEAMHLFNELNETGKNRAIEALNDFSLLEKYCKSST